MTFHRDRVHRFKLLSGGEGAGKSLGAAFEVMSEFPTWKLVYIVGPRYEACKKEFDYIRHALMMLQAISPGMVSAPARGQRSLRTRKGQRVITLSAEEGPDAITGTGESPDIILMVEAGKQNYDIFLACRGRVARSRGLLILSGTIEASQRWYPELIARWQSDNTEDAKSFIVPTWNNLTLYPGGRRDPEILALERAFTPERFKERFGAEPCTPSDCVIPEFSFASHVTAACQFDARAPVELWIDPGYSGSHYAVEAVQFDRRGARDIVNVIDELYLDHATTQEAIAQASTRPWWANVPRTDRRPAGERGVNERPTADGEEGPRFTGSGGVIDVAAKAHAAMPSVWQVWNEAGIALRTNRVEVAAGVELHRTFLKPPDGSPPRLMYNPACRGVFGEYNDWQRKKIGDGLFAEPSDKRCDAMKAIQYGLFDRYGALGTRAERRVVMVERDIYAESDAFNIR